MAWPVDGELSTVHRYNRKQILRGIKEDASKATWPLKWPQVVEVMQSCGWSTDEVGWQYYITRE